MKQHMKAAAAVGFGLLISSLSAVNAAEIKVISSNALKTVLQDLAPAFEKASEHKLVFTWGAAVPLKARIENDEAFDLAVLTVAGIDDLIKQGKLVGATRANLANSGAGVAVRKGAPKPDISTVEAFKRALLNAKSIAYVEQGGTGIYLKALLPRLGIADALKDKIKLLPPENPAAQAIANGEAHDPDQRNPALCGRRTRRSVPCRNPTHHLFCGRDRSKRSAIGTRQGADQVPHRTGGRPGVQGQGPRPGRMIDDQH